MDFTVQYLSFYMVTVDGKGESQDKRYRHFQTLDKDTYAASSLHEFLDGELAKIVKRKVDRHPKTDQAPTKVGHFIVEEGHDLTSNPNYNMLQRVQNAKTLDEFQQYAEFLTRTYIDTSAIRGGVFLIVSAKLSMLYDEPFVFILKCDFEPKVASIADETSLIHNVEMAITTKNMKSIVFPYMEEEGILHDNELKLHQASHARYFEDFLKFVAYGESLPEIVKNQVYDMVIEHVQETLPQEGEAIEKFEEAMQIWAESPKREIQEHFTTEEVVEAAAAITEHSPDLELKFKADHIAIKGYLSDFADTIHIAKVNNRYVTIIESDTLLFEKDFSPIEFLKPDEVQDVIEKIEKKTSEIPHFDIIE